MNFEYFILVGQLWIEEDEEQESFSQKIQLTNSTLRVEHSLKSKIKNVKKKETSKIINWFFLKIV